MKNDKCLYNIKMNEFEINTSLSPSHHNLHIERGRMKKRRRVFISDTLRYMIIYTYIHQTNHFQNSKFLSKHIQFRLVQDDAPSPRNHAYRKLHSSRSRWRSASWEVHPTTWSSSQKHNYWQNICSLIQSSHKFNETIMQFPDSMQINTFLHNPSRPFNPITI